MSENDMTKASSIFSKNIYILSSRWKLSNECSIWAYSHIKQRTNLTVTTAHKMTAIFILAAVRTSNFTNCTLFSMAKHKGIMSTMLRCLCWIYQNGNRRKFVMSFIFYFTLLQKQSDLGKSVLTDCTTTWHYYCPFEIGLRNVSWAQHVARIGESEMHFICEKFEKSQSWNQNS
jgi:hypothetical protein